jgi:hypothetical protein
LRGKLIDAEQELSQSKTKFDGLREEYSGIQQRQDIDRLSLQKEIVDKNKVIENQSKEFSLMDEKNRALLEANSDAVKTVDGLTNNLKNERARILDLENQLRESGNEKHRNLEVCNFSYLTNP